MSNPVLLNRRDFGGKLPPGSKSVDRNTPYGNPFRIGVHAMTRDEVIDRFETWAAQQPLLIARAKRELRGWNICCHCAPKRCHGLFWLRVSNEPD